KRPTDDTDDKSVTALREKIDSVNREILDRLQERAALVLVVAKIKQEKGLEGYDPGREDQMLHDLLSVSKGPFGPTELREIFRTIFRASLEIQERKRWEGLLVKQRDLLPPGGVRVGDVAIGAGRTIM